jgi:hypothetical protein
MTYLRLSLRFSAYLCVLGVKGYFNAENAKIRREPQRNLNGTSLAVTSAPPANRTPAGSGYKSRLEGEI